MRMTEHVDILTITKDGFTVHPVLLQGDNGVFLVDTGYPDQFDLLLAAICDAGFRPEDLNGIILTHQDIDHIGNARRLLKLAPGASVWAHVDEAPYIDGRAVPVKLAAADPSASEYAQHKALFAAASVPVAHTLSDGEILPVCGAVVIHTPGHTPGHICMYLPEPQILITGDAMNVRAGQLRGPNPMFTQDMEKAAASLEKLHVMPVQTIIAYHGGLYQGATRDWTPLP